MKTKILAQNFCRKHNIPNLYLGIVNLRFLNYNQKSKKRLLALIAKNLLLYPSDLKATLKDFNETENPLVLMETTYSNSHKTKYVDHYFYYKYKKYSILSYQCDGDFSGISRTIDKVHLSDYVNMPDIGAKEYAIELLAWLKGDIAKINYYKSKILSN